MAEQLDRKELDTFIHNALAEDIKDGDHTSLACIPPTAIGDAKLLVKENGILAGVDVGLRIFEIVDPNLEIDVRIKDGSKIEKGEVVLFVHGPALSILQAERLVLNCMQRMSGIATKTKSFVDKVKHTSTKIIDTRKTTPNIRFLEKYAVLQGGGGNHRMGLYDMVMIKDNHNDFSGGITNAINRVDKYLKEKQLNIPVEVETRNLKEVKEVLACGKVTRIMLDNFTPAQMKEAVELIDGRYETEGSGGINLDTVTPYAETGVDFISVGALTHSAVALDLSLKAVIRK